MHAGKAHAGVSRQQVKVNAVVAPPTTARSPASTGSVSNSSTSRHAGVTVEPAEVDHSVACKQHPRAMLYMGDQAAYDEHVAYGPA